MNRAKRDGARAKAVGSTTAPHTPGPWKAHLNVLTAIIPGHIIKTDDDIALPIASIPKGTGSKGPGEQIANAQLIAAAPELLKAAAKAVDQLRFLQVTGPQMANTYLVLRELTAAIGKAKGKAR